MLHFQHVPIFLSLGTNVRVAAFFPSPFWYESFSHFVDVNVMRSPCSLIWVFIIDILWSFATISPEGVYFSWQFFVACVLLVISLTQIGQYLFVAKINSRGIWNGLKWNLSSQPSSGQCSGIGTKWIHFRRWDPWYPIVEIWILHPTFICKEWETIKENSVKNVKQSIFFCKECETITFLIGQQHALAQAGGNMQGFKAVYKSLTAPHSE